LVTSFWLVAEAAIERGNLFFGGLTMSDGQENPVEGKNKLPAMVEDSGGQENSVAARRRAAIAMYAGLFLILFAAALAFGVYKYIEHDGSIANMASWEVVLIALALVGSVACAIYGTKAMLSEGGAPKIVIPNSDRVLLEELIRAGNDKGIDQYVRLSSLSGVTGTYTKLGLTGLPLATIGLTLFFSIVSLFHPDRFLDLAKLTLGAFIGSFVQRNVAGEKLAGDANKPPPKQ
jgi:hypothetical protein